MTPLNTPRLEFAPLANRSILHASTKSREDRSLAPCHRHLAAEGHYISVELPKTKIIVEKGEDGTDRAVGVTARLISGGGC